MRKTEFMDLLKYYFRKSDKEDLKGIIEDCNEQFRLGAEEGKSEEEICCKLGSPKNIYRYYIGKPIIPEDNPKMPYEYDTDRDNDHVTNDYDAPFENEMDDNTRAYRCPAERQAYDWEKDSKHPHRNNYRNNDGQHSRQIHPYQYEPQKNEFNWNGTDNVTASKIIVNPFLQILGTFFHIIGGFLFILFAASIIACIAITSMPLYLYSDLLPLPTITLKTMIFAILAILFAAMAAMYAGQACQSAGQQDNRRKGRDR